MPHFTRPITQEGGLLKVEIGVSGAQESIYRALGFQIERPLFVDGMVDTGASITAIDTDLAHLLNLSPRGKTTLRTPSTGNQAVVVDAYDASLSIPPANVGELPYRIPTLLVIAADNLKVQGFQVLIGRDVLSRCLFVYNGEQGTYTLAF